MNQRSLRIAFLIAAFIACASTSGDPVPPSDPPVAFGNTKALVKVFYLPSGQSLDKVLSVRGRLVSLNDQGYVHVVMIKDSDGTAVDRHKVRNEEADSSADADVSDVLIPAGLVISIKRIGK